MKLIKRIILLGAAILQTNISMSQQILIKELPIYRNDENLTEIGNRAEVLSVFPVDIERDILFSEDTLFKIELNDDEFNDTAIDKRCHCTSYRRNRDDKYSRYLSQSNNGRIKHSR